MNSDDYMPRTSVSFAATEPFNRRWQSEAKAQMEKFKQSTWQQDTEQEEAQAPPPTPDKPKPQDDEQRKQIIAFGILGALFLVAVAGGIYVIYKWRQN